MTVDLIKEFIAASKIRIKSPLLSSVVLVWILCNWHRLMLLFWGESPISNRVANFRENWDIFTSYLIPWSVAFLYVLLVPLIHRLIYEMTAANEEKHHAAWAKLERTKEEQKSAVEKERLKNDPSKEFLRKIVEIELLEKEKQAEKIIIELEQAELLKSREELERLAAADKLETQAAEKAKAEAELQIAQDKAKKAEAERKSAEFAAEKRIEHETMQLELKRKKHAAQFALHQLPLFMRLVFELDKELRNEQEVCLTAESLAEIVAISFGYKSYKELAEDKQFTIERLSQVQIIVYDFETIISSFDAVLSANNEAVHDTSLIIISLEHIFAEMDIKFLDIDILSELVLDEFNSNNEVLESDAVNSAMAETNAFFGESPYLEVTKVEAEQESGSIAILLEGHLSGEQDDDRMYSGHEINVHVEVSFLPLFGKSSYGEYEYVISAGVADCERE